MKLFILCWGQIVLYTLGVLVACGLAVEICYRLCFMLMGRRPGRFFWFATSWVGTPVHELGHAVMCLLFAHRIERIRLVPTRSGDAMVEHSYNKRNPYAVFGNLWIGLGPLFSGLAVMLGVLYLVYPASMQSYHNAVDLLLVGNAPTEQLWLCMWQFICGLLTEQTHSVWVRFISLVVMFALALHVRLSAQDIMGMISGLPGAAFVTAMIALVFTCVGNGVLTRLVEWLRQLAWLLVSLFGLIMLFGLVQLLLVAAYRLLQMFLRALRTKIFASGRYPYADDVDE